MFIKNIQIIHQQQNIFQKIWQVMNTPLLSGLILGLRPTNERWRYKVTPSLIGWGLV